MSLTGKFNAQNIGFNDPVERIENGFDPNDHAYIVDAGTDDAPQEALPNVNDLSPDAQQMLRTLQKAETIENSREEINIYNPQDEQDQAPITRRTPEDILFENRFNAGQTGADTGHSGLNNLTDVAKDILEMRGSSGEESPRKKVDKILESYNRMESFIHHLEAMAQFWEDKAREAREAAQAMHTQIDNNIERMQENSTFMGDAEKLLEGYKNGKAVDENAARKLLKKRGVEGVDDMSMAVLMQRLQDERDKADQENRTLDQDNETLERDAAAKEAEADKYDADADKIRDYANRVKSLDERHKNGEISDKDYEESKKALEDEMPEELKREVNYAIAPYQKTNKTAEKLFEMDDEALDKEIGGGGSLFDDFEDEDTTPVLADNIQSGAEEQKIPEEQDSTRTTTINTGFLPKP